jgi:hypothetical protein
LLNKQPIWFAKWRKHFCFPLSLKTKICTAKMKKTSKSWV